MMNDRRSSRGLPPPASDSSARYSRVGMRRTASVLSFFSRGSRITWCIVSLVIIFAITQFITFSSHADPKGNSPVQHQKNVHHQENPPVVSPSAVEIHHPPNQFTQPIQIQTKDGIREEEVEFPTPKDIDPYTGLLVSDFNTVQGVFYGHPYQQPYHGYDPLTEFKPLFYPPASPEYENIMREVFLGTTFVGTWTLTHRQLCDLEMILNGGFSPLRGFMNEKTYNSVVKEMRLAPLEEEETEFPYVVPGSVPGLDGNYRAVLFPMPITLDIPKSLAEEIKNEGDRVLLKDEEGNALAVLTVQGRPWIPDKLVEAQYVFGTTDTAHPGVDYLLNHAHDYYVGGSIEGVQMPVHYDFEDVRLSPKMLRDTFKQNGWKRIVAFQTRNPMHMAHIELVKMAAAETSAAVLIHPSVGMTKPGDIQYGVRVACYKAVLSSGRHFSPYTSILSLLPIAMRMGGPREALWHAIVRKNYGVTHFIIGRDHAGVSDRSGKGYYEPYAAQELVKFHEFELGIKIQTYKEFEYVPELDRYLPADKIPEGMETKSISGTRFRGMMERGEEIPSWFSDPAVINVLRSTNPPLSARGFTIFFTGYSGSGKTTIANALMLKLQSILPTRKIVSLDGDEFRTHMSKDLGFSLTDRNTNIERIGYAASKITEQGGIAIASPIAPTNSAREMARKLVESTKSGFILVHVSTSIGECASRDVKGLYHSAGYIHPEVTNASTAYYLQEILSGVTRDLTGVSHPFEMPVAPDVSIFTDWLSVNEAVDIVLAEIARQNYIDSRYSMKYLDVPAKDAELNVTPSSYAIEARLPNDAIALMLAMKNYQEEYLDSALQKLQLYTSVQGIRELEKDEKVLPASNWPDLHRTAPIANIPSHLLVSPNIHSLLVHPYALPLLFPKAFKPKQPKISPRDLSLYPLGDRTSMKCMLQTHIFPKKLYQTYVYALIGIDDPRGPLPAPYNQLTHEHYTLLRDLTLPYMPVFAWDSLPFERVVDGKSELVLTRAGLPSIGSSTARSILYAHAEKDKGNSEASHRPALLNNAAGITAKKIHLVLSPLSSILDEVVAIVNKMYHAHPVLVANDERIYQSEIEALLLESKLSKGTIVNQYKQPFGDLTAFSQLDLSSYESGNFDSMEYSVPLFANKSAQLHEIDALFTSGVLSLHSHLRNNPGALISAAWDLWTGLRWAHALSLSDDDYNWREHQEAEDNKSSIVSSSQLVVFSSRLIVHVENMLMFDPCLTVTIVLPSAAEEVATAKDVVNSITGDRLPPILNNSSTDASPDAKLSDNFSYLETYFDEYVKAAYNLAQLFPTRVSIENVELDN